MWWQDSKQCRDLGRKLRDLVRREAVSGMRCVGLIWDAFCLQQRVACVFYVRFMQYLTVAVATCKASEKYLQTFSQGLATKARLAQGLNSGQHRLAGSVDKVPSRSGIAGLAQEL